METFKITVVSETKEGIAIIKAKDYKEAWKLAQKACPKGFRVFDVQKKSAFQRLGGPAVMKSSMGKKGWEVVGEARIKRKPAFWNGKKTGDFKKC